MQVFTSEAKFKNAEKELEAKGFKWVRLNRGIDTTIYYENGEGEKAVLKLVPPKHSDFLIVKDGSDFKRAYDNEQEMLENADTPGWGNGQYILLVADPNGKWGNPRKKWRPVGRFISHFSAYEGQIHRWVWREIDGETVYY